MIVVRPMRSRASLVTRTLLLHALVLRLPASTCAEIVTMATMGMSRPFRVHSQYA
jgi:hypothetical protein